MALFKTYHSPRLVHQTQRLASKASFSAQVVRVCDGDTLTVSVDVPGQLLPTIEYIRLAGIDAPELRGPDRAAAIVARDQLAAWIELECVTVTPTRIWRDPYHRIIARVVFHGVDVGAWLLGRYLARERKSNKPHTNPMSHSVKH